MVTPTDWGQLTNAAQTADLSALDAGLPSERTELDEAWSLLVHAPSDEAAVAIAESLLARGASVDARDRFGNTPLYSNAARPAVAARLLVAGADPNAPELRGITPLMAAADHGSAAVLKLLLDAGADPNHAGNEGGTALLFACDQGHKACVELLLDVGASPDVVDKHRRTPLGLAKKSSILAGEAALLARLKKGASKVAGVEQSQKLRLATVGEQDLCSVEKEIGRLPDNLRGWLLLEGVVELRRGVASVRFIKLEEYPQEQAAFREWASDADAAVAQRLVPFAGPGGDDWCLLAHLDTGEVFYWWHEEAATLTPLGTDLEEMTKRIAATGSVEALFAKKRPGEGSKPKKTGKTKRKP